MRRLIANLLAVLALVGFFGQTTVRAMPIQSFHAVETVAPAPVQAAEEECAKIAGMAADLAGQEPAGGPCDDMTGECVGKMGCALSVFEPACAAANQTPIVYSPVVYATVDQTRTGVSVAPELFPPILLG